MKRFLLLAVSTGLSVAVLPETAFAESIIVPPVNPSDIVSVGTRIDTVGREELSSPASVIPEAEIKARNQAYVTDLLRTLPGVSVNSSGPAGALTQIRMRGSEASHTLVLIDGIEVANPNSGEFDFAGLRSADIVRIEVLRGEQSALYGSDAIGGVINIITRGGETKERYRASVEAGSFDTLEGNISAVIPIKGAALSVNANAFTTGGYDISDISGEDDGNQRRSFNISLNSVELGALTLSAKYDFSRSKTEFDSGFPRIGNTNDESYVDTTTSRIDARFDLWGFENLITASALETETETNGSFGNTSVGKRQNVNWAAKRELSTGTLTLLAETEEEHYSITPSFAGSPANPSNRNNAIAADYRFDNGSPFTATASIRQDFNERFDDATTWRVGGNYALSGINGRIRASVGTGVKNPSLIELFGFYPESNFVGNPDLKPETSLGYNIGYEHSFDKGMLSIDVFKSELEDEIFTDFSGFPFLPRNRDTDSTREGVELEGRFDAFETLSLRGSATFLDAEENGVTEVRRPDFLASATATWQATDTLSATLSLDHTGEQLDTDFVTFSPVTLDAFTLVGLNVGYSVNDILSVSLRGENLTDEDYQEVVGYASQGRAVYFGLSADF